jgi:hypothetical protein
MCAGKLAIYMQKTEARPYLSPCTKINCECIKDLNVRHGPLKQEKIWKTLDDIGIGNSFLNRTLVTQEISARIDKWDCFTLKCFCSSKETIT